MTPRPLCLLLFVFLISGAGACSAAEPRDPSLDNALAFLRSQQNADGSFGNAVQPHLQTAVALLAIVSSGARSCLRVTVRL